MRRGSLEVPVGGERLHVELYPGTNARRAILLLHGFLSEGREFDTAPEALAALGWDVIVPDLRGHGRSTGPRGYASERVATEDMRAVLAALAVEGVAPPLGLVGHSAGGALAARFLGIMPEFSCGALVAPLDTLKAETTGAEFAGYRAMHTLNGLVTRFGAKSVKVPYKFATRKGYHQLFDDSAAADRAFARGLIQKQADLAWYDDMMAISGSTWARDVTKPTLVVLATHDKAVKRASSLRVYDGLRGPKELREIASGHSAFGDVSAKELVAAIDQWFRKQHS
ncbi:MAG: alpha/beta hydrolase [Thermoplasmatota archaeon]